MSAHTSEAIPGWPDYAVTPDGRVFSWRGWRGVPITAPSIRKAARLGLDVWWFACQVLDGTALATYRAETAPALATCTDGTTETAWATYNAERAAALVPLLRAALR